MADPKYAALPGIAYDQPDYYESEDVCESFSNPISQDQSDCVENLNTNVMESYTKFKGCWLLSQKADFSGKIGVKHNLGYTSWNGPYELQADGEKESPIQKLNRLKCEVSELQQEVEQSLTDSEEFGDPQSLAMQVTFLQKQLMDIKINENGFPKTEISTKRKIFDDLEKVGKTVEDTLDQGTSTLDPSKIVYQLQFKPQQIKLDLASREANMLQRLEKLESLFGVPDKMNQLCAETGQKSVSDAIRSICSKVALLEPTHLDQVESRLSVLMQKLNVITKQHGIEDSSLSGTVKELYEMVKQLEPLLLLLPSIVDRLASLKVLHDRALNFSQTVTQVENMQTNLDIAIQDQLQLLTNVQEGLSMNMQAMKMSVQKLDDKLSNK
ncbi:hypothetical protein GHT06_008987 [Daphnia sinensis]|uniref:Dynactin subunit 2 n=1 Tax=Daphnia sinensis TaxID=1820382 RepID=A0AAD5L2A1_9CRUS|nr:hypothetical protein GHT06_008987 [Daphnia sinensis]